MYLISINFFKLGFVQSYYDHTFISQAYHVTFIVYMSWMSNCSQVVLHVNETNISYLINVFSSFDDLTCIASSISNDLIA